jgi:hypothetical protein
VDTQEKLLRSDFEGWSGGFPPESDYQITVYVDYALGIEIDTEVARQILRDWMCDEDNFVHVTKADFCSPSYEYDDGAGLAHPIIVPIGSLEATGKNDVDSFRIAGP